MDNNPMINKIIEMGFYINDPNNDGFTAFIQKQLLYKIKWECETQLDKSTKFVGEDEFLQLNLFN